MTTSLIERSAVLEQTAAFSVRSCQIITLTLSSWDLQKITESLQYQIKQAPDFFNQTSIIVAFDMPDGQSADLEQMNLLLLLLQHHQLQILGCMGPLWVKDLCRFFQIPYLKNSFTTQDDNEQYSHYKEGFALSLSVRPGQQYMRQGDLILLAPIHYGAEVLATGHIHAYARAQGRLLAGINGNQSAQIFCTSLQAELLSIAGVFLTKDLYPKKCLNQACRIFLDQKTQQLIFHPIS